MAVFAAVAATATAALAELPVDGTWREIGPALGQIGGITSDRSDPTLVIAATRSRGVFRSSNGGMTWSRGQRLSFGNKTRTVYSDPHQAGAFYALTSFTGRLSRSTDGGVTWSDVPGTFSGSSSAFAADPINVGVIYVGTSSNGLMRSPDSGASWERIDEASGTFSGVRVSSLAVDPLNADVVYASTQSSDPGIVQATFDGANWAFQSINAGLSNPTNAVLSFDASGVLYAAAANDVFSYNPGMDSWTSTSHPGGARIVAASPQTAGVLHTGGTDGIHRTSTGGGMGNWNLEADIALGEPLDFAFADNVVAGTDGFGVVRRDAGVWSMTNRGLNAGEMTSVLVDPSTPDRYLAGVPGPALVETLDGGATWGMSGTGLIPETAVSNLQFSAFKADRFFGSQGDDLYLSDDAGANWKNLDPGNAVTSSIRGLVEADAQTVFLGTTGGVYRGDISDPDNVVWTLENTGLTNTSLNGLVRDGSTGALYTVSFGGGGFRGEDGVTGLTWTNIPDDGPVNNFGLSIAIDEARGFVYFVNTSGSIFRLDLSATVEMFTQLSDDLPGTSGIRLFKPTGTTRLVASSSDNGLFFSEDDGVSWSPLGNLFPFEVVALVEDVHATDQYLAASRGASVALINDLPDLIFADGFETPP